MASVNKDKHGRFRIQFTSASKRRTLRLGGNVQEKAAMAIGGHIEQILDSRRYGTLLPTETTRWLNRLPNGLRKQLCGLGVIDDTGSRSVGTLDAFLAEHISRRKDIQTSTTTQLQTARRWLVEYFGADRRLDSISPGDADLYRLWLQGKQAPNTANRLCGRARQFFRAALRLRLIGENPFNDMEGLAVGPSPKVRMAYIDGKTADAVLRACPNDEWRVIFALARYGGLRVPSEIFSLLWADVDWDNERLLVKCQKTKRHEGKAVRIVPLFAELRQQLELWRKVAPPDQETVLRPTVSRKTNLRSGLIRILKKANIEPWPKLYQNLRATRSTELRDHFPAHVVASWLGHSVKVADKHYNQVTEEHFRKATTIVTVGAPQGAA